MPAPTWDESELRLRAFDLAGLISVVLFAGVLAMDLGALRRPGEEVKPTVSPQELASGFREGVTWHGFYLRGTKMGFSRLEHRRLEDGFRLLSHALFDLEVMRTRQRIELDLDAQLDSGFALRSFTAEVDTELTSLTASGEVVDGRLDLVIRSAGISDRTSIQLDSPPVLDFNIRPLFLTQQPEIGQRFDFEYFDPFKLKTKTLSIEYRGREEIMIVDQEISAHHLQQHLDGQVFDAWVNDLGEVLREELPLGLTAIREDEAEATYGLGRAFSRPVADLIAATAIPAPGAPRDPETVAVAGYRLSNVNLEGFDLDGARQHFVAASGCLTVVREGDEAGSEVADLANPGPELTPYLAAEPLLQVNDDEIRALAGELAAGRASVRSRVAAIVWWVHDNLEKANVVSIPSAREVLAARRGDCNEHTVLAVALLRAADIPTRTVTGIALADGSFYYHAWLEYWDGRWVTADPTWGQQPADVGHLRFVIGGLTRQMDILRLLGNLRVVGDETCHELKQP